MNKLSCLEVYIGQTGQLYKKWILEHVILFLNGKYPTLNI